MDAAMLARRAAHIHGVCAAADAVTALQDGDVEAVPPEALRGAHAREARAQDQHLHGARALPAGCCAQHMVDSLSLDRHQITGECAVREVIGLRLRHAGGGGGARPANVSVRLMRATAALVNPTCARPAV